MPVSKPFTYALALEQHGIDFMIDRIGVSATGFPYNAVAAGAVRCTSEQNPLVNAGAIATHGYIESATPASKINAVIELYSRMANRPLSIEENWRVIPRALTYTLAYQMKASGRLEGAVEDITERYLESNIVAVTVEDLANMGATLAAGGIQSQSGERILKSGTVRTVLSVMVIAGMYEGSGAGGLAWDCRQKVASAARSWPWCRVGVQSSRTRRDWMSPATAFVVLWQFVNWPIAGHFTLSTA